MENSNTAKTIKSSQSTGSNFEEMYAAKNYKGAIDYLLQNKGRYDSGIFHYNLGTTYAKLNDFGAARYHLEKANSLGLHNTALINNLEFVRSKIVVDDLSTSGQQIDRMIDWSVSVSPDFYYSLTLGLLAFFFMLSLIKKIFDKWKMGFFIIIAIVPVLYLKLFVENVNCAVAMKEVPLYEGPSKIFQEKGKVMTGSKIVLGEYKDGWFFVKYPLSLSGWVTKENLGLY